LNTILTILGFREETRKFKELMNFGSFWRLSHSTWNWWGKTESWWLIWFWNAAAALQKPETWKRRTNAPY